MLSRIKQILIGIALGAAALFAAFTRGWQQAKARAKAKQQAEADKLYRETMERVKDADLSSGDDGADRDWLQQRGKR